MNVDLNKLIQFDPPPELTVSVLGAGLFLGTGRLSLKGLRRVVAARYWILSMCSWTGVAGAVAGAGSNSFLALSASHTGGASSLTRPQ